MTFKIPVEGPTCLRCGHDKKLHALREPALGMADDTDSEFFVCQNKVKCRTRQLAARPARMTTQAAPDTRECGFMGCGDSRCEPFCAGIAREK